MVRRLVAFLLPLLLMSTSATPRGGEIHGRTADRGSILGHQFAKQLVEVATGVYVAVGFGAANSTLIVGDDGVIIVDTMYGTEEAEHVLSEYRRITDKPVVAIIYTHSHSDHIGGASVFAAGGTEAIFGRKPASAGLDGYDEIGDILKTRARRQFGADLPDAEKIDGIAPVHRPKRGVGAGKLPPTRILSSERDRITIAGVDLELIAAPGESPDHQVVWVPEKRVLVGGDNFYMSFPNLYAIRGTPYRDVSVWASSLDLMIGLGADALISGHARPIVGEEDVRRALTDYRNAIDFVLHETLAGANRGLTPEELAASVRLPESLAGKDYLQEFYGVVDWSVRSIYAGYFGWFDGNPTNLFPLSPKDEAERMVGLVGSREEILDAVRRSIEGGDFQWACQLADQLLALEPPSPEARHLKATSLRALAERQTSSNARHYYLSVARELEAIHE